MLRQAAGITYAVKLTECDTTGGTYTDLSGVHSQQPLQTLHWLNS